MPSWLSLTLATFVFLFCFWNSYDNAIHGAYTMAIGIGSLGAFNLGYMIYLIIKMAKKK